MRTKILTTLPLMFNSAVMVSHLMDGNPKKALYWFGAVCICLSLFWMEFE